MKDVKLTKQPITNQHQLSKEQCPKNEEDRDYMSKVPYANAVGYIMYLMLCTRPNIAYAISARTTIEGYCDADYVGDRDSRRSTSAYFFLIGGNCVSWKVQLQSVVALSTIESEYVATT
ncbi:secreted RxLR effector protein 161-like [Humulus lupulus]|uniref:secreted RxLR effector protein 161-like n=1 Tax=Humulus lupulus TaxID=3486 RepID=UPI002B4139CD|nr:secreted RxLR effector protein 161-like [Humulus lupulus]